MPAIHGGILARRTDEDHAKAMADHKIAAIDLVVVNLYPFEATVARGADFATCVENIDIGGPALIRASAKNHDFVTVVVDPADYEAVLDEIGAHKGATTLALRRKLAAKAYARTASYDSAIATWFAGAAGRDLPRAADDCGRARAEPCATARTRTRRPRSMPTAASGRASRRRARSRARNFPTTTSTTPKPPMNVSPSSASPRWCVIKHANPCGVAIGADQYSAYLKAYACDPVSIYRRHRRRQPHARGGDRDRPRQALPRGGHRARCDGRGARDPGAAQGTCASCWPARCPIRRAPA